MTKNQLLAELLAQNWCDFVGTEELQETKPDGTKWYNVNIRDVSGKVAVYRNVNFYVVDEGGGGEAAYYKDKEPSDTQNVETDLKQWMRDTILVNPNNYKGIQILWMSELLEMVIYCILEGSPLTQKVYYIRRGAGSPTEIQDFNIDWLKTIFTA